MPLISVVIPVYNGEKTIRETIESVLNQTFTDLELIVIDDGSTDSTIEVVKSITDSRIKIFSYPNGGPSVSRNRGISLAVGEYISFIDADDMWTEDKLELQLKTLQENPEAAVAYSWTKYIDEQDNYIAKGRCKNISGNVYPYMLSTNILESGSNGLIRTEALKEVGNFDELIFGPEDWDLYIRLSARYHFVAVCKPQILYRKVENSLSSNLLNMEAAGRRVLEKAFAQAPDSLQYIKQIIWKNRYKYYIFKALEGSTNRHRGIIALQFLLLAIQYDLSLLQTRVIWKVLLIIFLVIMLPRQIYQAAINKFPGTFNIYALIHKEDILTEVENYLC